MSTPDLALMFDWERTEFADECYAAIGRALALACMFERNVRALLVPLDIVEAACKSDDPITLETIKMIFEAVQKRNLHNTIVRVTGLAGFKSRSLYEMLDTARKARNTIAHEIAYGLEPRIQTDAGRDDVLNTVKTEGGKIAVANFVVTTLLDYFDTREIPSTTIVAPYLEHIDHWLTMVER